MRDCDALYLPSHLNMANRELKRLKVVVAEKKKTNKWLGVQLGKDKTTISKWCTNTCQPDLGNLIKNYYLSLLDRLERGANENRSIGIILCAEEDRVEVELALEDMGKPIGVADYQLIVPKEKLQKVLEINKEDK